MPTEPLPPTDEFLSAAAKLGIEFESGDVERLGSFLAIMLETNKSFNLTAITDPAQAWMRHIFDSLTLVPLLADLPPGATVIDIGSGGGVPGLPLAIILPALSFTLVDATGKKANFLRATVGELALTNVKVFHDRAERLGQNSVFREKYDVAMARALGPLNTLAELTVPLVKVGGIILAIKGAKAEQEIEEAREAFELLGATYDQTVPTATGRIVVLLKSKHTHKTYPRRDGEPKNKPLGAVENR